MKKFEYMTEEWLPTTSTPLSEWLNSHGANGWEVVDSFETDPGVTYTFKREIEPEWEYDVVLQSYNIKYQVERREKAGWELLAVVPSSMPLLTRGERMVVNNKLVFRREKK